MQLTEEQLKHFESVKWFMFGPCGSGKSFLAAVICILRAMEYPNEWVYPIDHSRNAGNTNLLMEQIKYIISSGNIPDDAKGEFVFEHRQRRFRYIG